MKLTSLLEDLFRISLTRDKESILLIGPSGYKTFFGTKIFKEGKNHCIKSRIFCGEIIRILFIFFKSES